MTRSSRAWFPTVRSMLAAALIFVHVAAGAATATLIHDDVLRAQPAHDAGTVMSLHRLGSVNVLDVRRDWSLVEAAGNRRGWVPTSSLRPDDPAPMAAVPPLPAATSRASYRPRPQPHASRHALLLNLDASASPGPRRDDRIPVGLARALGVPDGNIRYLDTLDPDPIRRALADLDGRTGPGDRVFLHIRVAADGGHPASPHTAARLSARDGSFEPAELGRYAQTLAATAGQVLIVVDAPDPWRAAFKASPANLSLLTGPADGAASRALLACLDGDAPLSSPVGLARLDDLRRCAQVQLDRNAPKAGRQLHLLGNADLVPIPTLTPTPTRDFTPAALLHGLHAQRDVNRALDVRRQGDSLRIVAPRAGFLYVLHAPRTGRGFELLLPDASTGELRLSAGVATRLSLPVMPDGPLLVLVSDAPRRFLRAGFTAAGPILATPLDDRSLRDLPGEVLEGDNEPRCLQAETRNLGAEQALRCSTAFAATFLEAATP